MLPRQGSVGRGRQFNVNIYELAERLGLEKARRFVIVHCDDLGMSWGANAAAKELLTKGVPKGGSVLITCPWAYDFLLWWRQHPDLDIGIHLTLNSEWATYRWRPLTDSSQVPGLVDSNGFMHRGVKEVARSATADEVYRELCQQIETAINWGVTPTHVDTHMGTVFATLEFAQAYLRAAREYNLVPMLIEPSPMVLETLRSSGYPEALVDLLKAAPVPKLDALLSAPAQDAYESKKAAIFAQLANLPEGVSYYIIHPNINTEEMPTVTDSWQQRHWECQIFMEQETRDQIAELGIEVITWSQLVKAAQE